MRGSTHNKRLLTLTDILLAQCAHGAHIAIQIGDMRERIVIILMLRCCECQFRAIMATAMDTTKWESYRISKSVLIDEQPAGQIAASMSRCLPDQVLVNTSKTARSFAKGPESNRRVPSDSAAGATASSLWGRIWQQKKDENSLKAGAHGWEVDPGRKPHHVPLLKTSLLWA